MRSSCQALLSVKLLQRALQTWLWHLFGCEEQAPQERTCCAGAWQAWSVWSAPVCCAWRRSSLVILLRLYPRAWRERYEAEMPDTSLTPGFQDPGSRITTAPHPRQSTPIREPGLREQWGQGGGPGAVISAQTRST